MSLGETTTAGEHGVRLLDADFPVDDQGRTYHLYVRFGEVANRILSVGSMQRAKTLSEFLDSIELTVEAPRGFVVYTGYYNSIRVSIIGTGMGFPNLDMVIREAVAMIDGDVNVIRFGTCGNISLTPGFRMMVANEGVYILRNPDAWTIKYTTSSSTSSDDSKDSCEESKPYRISLPVRSDIQLTEKLVEKLSASFGAESVTTGLNVTADLFYCSQGRTETHFDDCNAEILNDVLERYPNAISMEMETTHLFDLARCAKGRSIRAAACAIAIANRHVHEFMPKSMQIDYEVRGARAVLDALTSVPLYSEEKERDLSLNPPVGC